MYRWWKIINSVDLKTILYNELKNVSQFTVMFEFPILYAVGVFFWLQALFC